MIACTQKQLINPGMLNLEPFGARSLWQSDALLPTLDFALSPSPYRSSSATTVFEELPSFGPTDIVLADFLGDSPGTAYNFGNLSGNMNVRQFSSVNPTNLADFYTFSLGDSNNVRLSLTGLSADADISLFQVTPQGVQRIELSQNPGTLNEIINVSLRLGVYYIQVNSFDRATTDYTLLIETQGPDVDAGNTLANAFDLGELSRWSYNRGESIGNTDLKDVYRFELRESTTLNLSVTIRSGPTTAERIGADLNVAIRDISGALILPLTNPGLQSETTTLTLNPGVYYTEVYAAQPTRISASVPYTLELQGTQYVNANPNFSPTYGYGLVNAASAVAAAIRANPFANVADLGGRNWNLDLINAPEVWAEGYTGREITVAVIDSGVDINHPDLRNNIWVNVNEIPYDGIDNDRNGYIDDIVGWNFGLGQNNNNVLPKNEFNAHGTHVAGTIAAANNSFGITGVAPDAKIMAIRLGDVDESGRFTNAGSLPKAIRYAVDNGAQVINLSLGTRDSADIQAALKYASDRNVIVVSAAGNNAVESLGIPARYAINYGIAVGSVDIQRRISSFSNTATADSRMQYVVAPGAKIVSTLPDNNYGLQNGTSMAAPHVAGIVALMLSANPYLSAAQVRQIITNTATRLT